MNVVTQQREYQQQHKEAAARSFTYAVTCQPILPAPGFRKRAS